MKWALLLPLLVGAVTVGSLHTLAPDHWAPFAALARARRWSAWRTTGVTVLCGFGHVTVSVLLGLIGLAAGIGLMGAIGQRMEAFAGLLLIAFGIGYAAWGIRRAAGEKLHGHTHRHYDHVHDESHASEWTLFALFSADPCVAVIPLLLASAPLGAAGATIVVVAYELATIGTMVALVLPARAGLRVIRSPWLERHEHATAGAFIAAVGVVVGLLGI
jgi:nickel/cobalt exporter